MDFGDIILVVLVVLTFIVPYIFIIKEKIDKKKEEKDRELHPEKYIKKYSKTNDGGYYDKYIKGLYDKETIYGLPSVKAGFISDEEYEKQLIIYLEEQHPEITEKEYFERFKSGSIFDYRPITVFNLFNIVRYRKATEQIEKELIKKDILYIEKELDDYEFFYPKSQKAQYHKHFMDEIKKIDKR